ncbi:hypothetical protein GKA92_21390, partial [Salmonella enterica subsp. enterica]|nr:hypothetical protein [Salmonella enterica subsp. enterica serovar Abaetetuba]
MPVLISGVLKDGTGTPVQNCTIQLKALNTTSAVIVTTTSATKTTAGQYSIDAQAGRYAVSLSVDGWPPQKVGVIDVYADSPDGSLNDFLTKVSDDYLRPDALKQFEQMTQQAEASAAQSKSAADGMAQIRTDAQTARDAAVQAGQEAAGQAQQAGQ